MDEDHEHRGGKAESPRGSRRSSVGHGRARRLLSPHNTHAPAGLPRTSDVVRLQDVLDRSLVLGEPGEEDRRTIGTRGTARGTMMMVTKMETNLKPMTMVGKEGSSGTAVPLLTNYFALVKRPTWTLYQHRVDFAPMEDNMSRKKGLLRQHAEALGPYIFDGATLYAPKELCTHEPLKFTSIRKQDDEPITITIRLTGDVNTEDLMYISFFNLVVRKCLYGMGFDLIGRNFFDRIAAIEVKQHRLALWPGFDTSVRRHEKDTLLCVELTNKVLRLDTVLHTIYSCKSSRDYRKAVEQELLDTVVMTHYNRKTYTVTDIAWDISPKSKFDRKGSPETYADYYRSRYEVEIKDMDQPLLVVKSREKDFRQPKGVDAPSKPIHLIPETCQMTGLSEAMRGNFSLMKDLAQYLHVGPAAKVNSLVAFMKRLVSVPENRAELNKWELDFSDQLSHCTGRVLPREGIIFAGDKPEMANDKADWTNAFRTRQMLTAVNLERWVIVVPVKDAPNVDNLVMTMTRVAKPINMTVRPPLEIVKLNDIRSLSYIQAVEKANMQHKGTLQLIFVILPNNKEELYGMVKRRLSCDFGIPSQCFLAKNVTSKGLMSIATKVVIQINAKLGGQPWTVKLPMQKTMIVGFDVHHGKKSKAVGALVATTSANFASYFSTISYHTTPEELSSNLNMDMTKALRAYESKNHELPERIIMYRDGVGEGQLAHVKETEISQLNAALFLLYKEKGLEFPKFSFIIVTKKINTRLFTASRTPDNPPPGTICDNIITLPQRYDFYLIASTARQGTVSPCSYIVLHDTSGLDADKIQRITYKLCHLYYNWSGTVAVPAPCQYAHKLAYLTGLALGSGTPHQNLQNRLHFL